MAGEWQLLSLREAGVTLIDCDHRTPPPSEAGYPYVAIPQLRNGCIDLTDVRRITQEHFNEWTRKAKPTANDVVLSRRCNPGETAYVPPGLEFALGQNLVLLRADGKKVFSPFLRWLVRGPEWWGQIGKFLNVGAVFDSLKCADVPKFELHIPPVDEQRAIAHILGTLDDKIELNRRMNETLEAIARAMFKSWFVDFDPVRAKMSGEPPESICQRLGLTPDLLTLFPDRLVDSELGEIPAGWDVKSLDVIADYLNGLALQKFPPESETEWLPVIKIAQLKKGDSSGADRASHNLKSEYVVNDGDVLFSWSGSLEVDVWCGGRGALNQHLFKVTSANYPKWFYYQWTKHHLENFQAIAAGKAVTMGHIQRKHMTQALCVVPRKPLMDKLDDIMEPLLDKQIENRKESRTLAIVRDELLPKLLSGELRVPQAETIMEAQA